MDTLIIILFSVGLGLVLAEILLPGGVAAAIGVSLILVAALRYFGHAATVPKLILLWALIAPVCLVVGILLARRLFGGSTNRKRYDEDAALVGETGQVIETVATDNDSGRVQWRQTSWSARSATIPLPVGAQVRILKQSGLSILVENIPGSQEKTE